MDAENGYRPRPTFWDCTVPSNEQLSLAQIADLWSQDTDGTPLARNSIELLAELLDAFRKGGFTVARGQDELQPSLSKWREFGNNVKCAGPKRYHSEAKAHAGRIFALG